MEKIRYWVAIERQNETTFRIVIFDGPDESSPVLLRTLWTSSIKKAREDLEKIFEFVGYAYMKFGMDKTHASVKEFLQALENSKND